MNMKKFILFSAFAVSMIYVQAQSKVTNTINNTTKAVTTGINNTAKSVTNTIKKQSFGIKTGFNLANTSNSLAPLAPGANVYSDPKMKMGLILGVFSQFQLSEGLRLQPELMYSAEGSIIDGKIGASSTMATLFRNRINYLNIPLMLQFTKGSGFYAEVGPQLGFRLSAKYKFENPTTTGGGQTSVTDMKNTTKGTAFSLGAGVGYELPSGIGLGLRYMFGLTDISTTSTSIKSNVLSIGLQYRFKGNN
jgi:hypothetical protein